jgi:hypothetical protein
MAVRLGKAYLAPSGVKEKEESISLDYRDEKRLKGHSILENKESAEALSKVSGIADCWPLSQLEVYVFLLVTRLCPV